MDILSVGIVLHFSVGFILSMTGYYHKRLYLFGFLAGIGKEVFDYIDYGLFDPIDMLATWAGATTAILLLTFIKYGVKYLNG